MTMTSIYKDPVSGVWHVQEGDMVFPAASWGEAMWFVHDMGEHRIKQQAPRKPTKGQIIAEEYGHFAKFLGPKLAVQRLAAVYHITPKTVERYITK